MTALLDGKVAIITGASRGIGRELAVTFARAGAAVVCTARTADQVGETARLITDAGGRAIAVTADAANEDEVRGLVEQAIDAFGSVTTLVNNAGDSGPTKPLEQTEMDDWFYTINSCLTSSYLCARFVVEPMVKAGGGSIINIASQAGRRGLAYRVGYCSAKAGQVGMTYGLALELGPRGIRVNCVSPGAVAGDRIDRVIAGQAKARGISEDKVRDAMTQRAPLGELTGPDDIANAALFLASDLAKNIGGQVLAVNGGQPAG